MCINPELHRESLPEVSNSTTEQEYLESALVSFPVNSDELMSSKTPTQIQADSQTFSKSTSMAMRNLLKKNLSLKIQESKSVSYPSLPSIAYEANTNSEFDKSMKSVLGPLYSRKTISTTHTTDGSSTYTKKKNSKRRPSFQGKVALRQALLKKNHSSLPALHLTDDVNAIYRSNPDNRQNSGITRPIQFMGIDHSIHTSQPVFKNEGHLGNGVHESVPALYYKAPIDYRFNDMNSRKQSFHSENRFERVDDLI